jgi:hypothetical protein
VSKNKIFLYVFVFVVTLQVVLLFPTRQSAKEVIEVAEKFENLKKELQGFKSFDDSLIGNEKFRNRLLDTVKTVSKLREVRENQKDKLEKGIGEFRTLHHHREKVIMKYKILHGVSDLLSVLFVCMAIPLIIYVFKRR